MRFASVSPTRLAVMALIAAAAGMAAVTDTLGIHNSGQAPTARTGAPGETNCGSCHTGNIFTSSAAVSLAGITAYVPGQTYTLTITLTDPTFANPKYGFSLTALDPTNAMAGSFALTNTTNTALGTNVISGGSRQYVGHKTASANNTWSFTWTAPATNLGAITFYLVGNAANNNGANSGDRIHRNTLVIQPQATPAPTATIAAPAAACQNTPLTLNATNQTGNITTYAWDFGPGASPQTANTPGPHTVSYASSGIKTVTLTVAGPDGSTAATGNISVLAPPTPPAIQGQPASLSACDGDTLTLAPAPGTTYAAYAWSNGATTPTLQLTSAGTYTLTVTDANGCQATAAPATVTILPKPQPIPAAQYPAAAAALCPGDTATLTLPNQTYAAYAWSTGATTPTAAATGPGPYTVSVTAPNGCTATSTPVTLALFPAPGIFVDANPAQICAGDSALLTANTGTPPNCPITWSSTQTGGAVWASAPGTYCATFCDFNGCTATACTTLAVLPAPIVSILPSADSVALCPGSCITLAANSPTATTYAWLPAGFGPANSVQLCAPQTQILVAAAPNGCTARDTVTIYFSNALNPVITAASGGSAFCPGDSITLTVGNYTAYQWTTGDTTATLTLTAPTTVSVSVSDPSGCAGTSPAFTATLHPPVNLAIQQPLPALLLAQPNTLPAYQWYTLLAGTPTPIPGATQAALTISANGTYLLQAIDNNGCEASAQFTVANVATDPAPHAPTLRLYPNPVRDLLTLDLPQPLPQAIRLYDPAGRLLLHLHPTEAHVQLPVSTLAPGCYRVSADAASAVFIKQ